MQKELVLTQQASKLCLEIEDIDLIKRTLTVVTAIREHLQLRETVRPYKLVEIRRIEN
jgi:hypothetical protein